MSPPIFSDPEKLAEAKRLRAAGLTDTSIARRFGCSLNTIARNIDDDAKARSLVRERERDRRRRDEVRAAEATILRPEIDVRYRATRDEIAARLAEIPRDTRSLTGRLLGDPVFERSALFQKRSSNA